ncbi:MAG: protein jag [Anaerolineae bacterium]|nr:protein jag [Anaerolineae bacterium]
MSGEGNARSAEFEGKTVEEAIARGLEALGLSRDQVEVEVLNPGSRGFLGLGGENARVRLTPTAPPQEAPTPEATAEAEAPAPAAAPEEAPAVSQEAVGIAPEDAAVAQELLEGLLRHLGLRATVEQRFAPPDPGQDQGTLILDVRGRDLSVLIGRQAEALRALQYILRLMVSHRLGRWINVVVDVEGYKERRQVLLEQLAHRMAERVVLSGRPVALEPMPPHERRIVHLALRDHPQVTTESIGQGDRRRVTIRLREPREG